MPNLIGQNLQQIQERNQDINTLRPIISRLFYETSVI